MSHTKTHVMLTLTHMYSVFAGEIFRFDIGAEPRTFTIHSQLVSRNSPAFDSMMRVQMKESREGRARLEHIDHDTFVRFAEYLYGHNYNSAEALVVLDQTIDDDTADKRLGVVQHTISTTNSAGFSFSSPPSDEPVADDVDWGFGSLMSSKKQKKKLPVRSSPVRPLRLEELKDVTFPGGQVTPFPVFHNKSAHNDVGLRYDYTEISSHIKLYAFAKQYMIEDLQKLILNKLRAALDQTGFHSRKMCDFIDILVLAHETTEDQDGKDPLLSLLKLFAAWHFQDLVKAKNFSVLLENRDCMMDLCQKVARRL